MGACLISFDCFLGFGFSSDYSDYYSDSATFFVGLTGWATLPLTCFGFTSSYDYEDYFLAAILACLTSFFDFGGAIISSSDSSEGSLFFFWTGLVTTLVGCFFTGSYSLSDDYSTFLTCFFCWATTFLGLTSSSD